MTVRKLDDGKPRLRLAEVYPQGRDGPPKRFATKGEAQVWETWLLVETGELPESYSEMSQNHARRHGYRMPIGVDRKEILKGE